MVSDARDGNCKIDQDIHTVGSVPKLDTLSRRKRAARLSKLILAG
jgi:hypothetical protein